jgi:hypothetical protein
VKIHYIGANCRTGVSEKNGRHYTIAELSYAVPDTDSQKNHDDGSVIWRYVGHGNKVKTINLDPACLSRFADIRPGTEIDVKLEPDPNNPTRNVVTGINGG